MKSFDRKMVEQDFRRSIKEICDVHGPSGFENDCIDLIKNMIEGYSVEISEDVMLNLIAYKKGNRHKKVAITAHTDEIGLIIRRIDEHGWLWVEALGGVRPQQLFGKHVAIKTENGYVDGIVNCIKPGRPESCVDIPPISDFFVEIGAGTLQDALDMGIEVGNPISIDYPLIFLGKNKEMVAGKALDDRACVFMLIELLKLIKDDEDIPDIYAIFSSQEEVGCRGAKVASHNIKPDIAISLDISIASDVPAVSDRKVITKIGDGPAIKVMDKISNSQVGVICSQSVVKDMKKAAKKSGIKYQIEAYANGGTDIDTMQTENGGMLTGGIMVPTRYVHSYEMCSVKEIVDCIELLYNYIKCL